MLPSVAAQPRRSRGSPSSPGTCDGSPQTPSPPPNPVPPGPAPTQTQRCKSLLFITHEVRHNLLFTGEYSTCISQSKRSSSFRICSLSCLMSLDLSMAFEFTLQIQTRIIICNFSLLQSRPMVNEYEIYYWKDQSFGLFMTKFFLKKKKGSATCSQDSSRLSFMLARRLFSSSTSLINFLRVTYKKQQIRIGAKQQKTCWLGTFK